MTDSLVIAVSKGRVKQELLQLLERADITVEDNDRNLLAAIPQWNASLMTVRNWDTPIFVSRGAAVLGVVGSDILAESRQLDFFQLLDLGTAKCQLCLAAPEGVALPARIDVATKYPYLATSLLRELNYEVNPVVLQGSHEVSCKLGIADAICDIVDTGKTLAQNGLVVHRELLSVSTQIIGNVGSCRTHYRQVQALLENIKEIL